MPIKIKTTFGLLTTFTIVFLAQISTQFQRYHGHSRRPYKPSYNDDDYYRSSPISYQNENDDDDYYGSRYRGNSWGDDEYRQSRYERDDEYRQPRYERDDEYRQSRYERDERDEIIARKRRREREDQLKILMENERQERIKLRRQRRREEQKRSKKEKIRRWFSDISNKRKIKKRYNEKKNEYNPPKYQKLFPITSKFIRPRNKTTPTTMTTTIGPIYKSDTNGSYDIIKKIKNKYRVPAVCNPNKTDKNIKLSDYKGLVCTICGEIFTNYEAAQKLGYAYDQVQPCDELRTFNCSKYNIAVSAHGPMDIERRALDYCKKENLTFYK